MGVARTKSWTHRMLTNILQRRMRGDLDQPELPFVVENRDISGRNVHLLVIWDAWRRHPNVERSNIIMDAYALAHPNDPAPAVAMGFTSSEAISLGYLPFRIAARVRQTDGVSRKKLDEIMKKAGGVQVRIGDELELRFATHAQAASAYRRLVAVLPSPVWTLIEERATAETA